MNYTHMVTLHERFYHPIKSGEMTAITMNCETAVQRGDLLSFRFKDEFGGELCNNALADRVFEVTFVVSGNGISENRCLVCFKIMPF